MLFGACEWDGKELKSLDGDSYYTDDVIGMYEWEDEDHLVVWILSKWITDEKPKKHKEISIYDLLDDWIFPIGGIIVSIWFIYYFMSIN